jgi:hypothetical protein
LLSRGYLTQANTNFFFKGIFIFFTKTQDIKRDIFFFSVQTLRFTLKRIFNFSTRSLMFSLKRIFNFSAQDNEISVKRLFNFSAWSLRFYLKVDLLSFQHPQIQKKTSKYIRYFCTENKAALDQWVMGIRMAKVYSYIYSQTCIKRSPFLLIIWFDPNALKPCFCRSMVFSGYSGFLHQ